MSGRLIRTLAVAVAAVAVACSVPAYAKGWEPLRVEIADLRPVARMGDVEVRVGPGYVAVATSQQVQIKVFTILGQVVSSGTVAPGVSRLNLSHGVYIVKVGDLTCKVAV